MSSKDPYASLPDLAKSAGAIEEVRSSGDPSRFYPSVGGGNVDAVTGRILNVPRASVYLQNSLSFNDGVSTLVAWDHEEYDTDNMWNANNGPELKINTSGLYSVNAWMMLQVGTPTVDGYRSIYIRKNGAGVWAPQILRPANPPYADSAIGTSVHMALLAGDTIDVIIGQVSGGFLNNDNASLLNRFNGFQAVWVSSFGSDQQ